MGDLFLFFRTSLILALSDSTTNPDFIKDIPDEGIKNWLSYGLKYKTISFIVISIIVLILGLLIYRLIYSEEVTVLGFTIKGNKKKDKKSDVPQTIGEYERKIGSLNGRISELEEKSLEKQKEVQFRSRQLRVADNRIQELTANYQELVDVSEGAKNKILALSEAIIYITSPNDRFDKCMNREIKPTPAMIKDIYEEFQYNLHQCLTHKGNNIRISIMKHDQSSDYLQIVAKHGSFKCESGQFILRRGEGLAGQCVAECKIINIPNVKVINEDVAQTDLRYIDGYVPPVSSDLTTSSLHVPIYVAGEAVGAINITSPRENAFNGEDELIAQLFAEKISRIWTIEKFRKKK